MFGKKEKAGKKLRMGLNLLNAISDNIGNIVSEAVDIRETDPEYFQELRESLYKLNERAFYGYDQLAKFDLGPQDMEEVI